MRSKFALLFVVICSVFALACGSSPLAPSASSAVPGIESGDVMFHATSVSFNSADGTGFVGKGDVQTAFGWNNATLQNNADGVSFSYNATQTYAATCTWITGEGTKGEKTHNVDHNKTAEINSDISYDARKHQQIDGFILTGFGTVSESGEVPEVGAPCPGNPGTDGVWTAVTLTGSSGGLYVNYDGQSKPLL